MGQYYMVFHHFGLIPNLQTIHLYVKLSMLKPIFLYLWEFPLPFYLKMVKLHRPFEYYTLV